MVLLRCLKNKIDPPLATIHGDQGPYFLISGQGSLLHTSYSTWVPLQSCPPFWGVGLSHFLLLTLYPPPHVAEQSSHVPQLLHPPSLGSCLFSEQGGLWIQYIWALSGPTHTRPPCAGLGFPQVRKRDLYAKPQLALHSDHADHCVHPPCTVQFVTVIEIP